MLDPASGARMGRPCYLVISAMENRVTGVTGAPRFPHVSTNAKRSSLLRRPTSRFARLLEALLVLTGETRSGQATNASQRFVGICDGALAGRKARPKRGQRR